MAEVGENVRPWKQMKVLRFFKAVSLRGAEQAPTFASMNETFVIFVI